MSCRVVRPVPWFLLIGVVLACLVIVAGDAEAVDRPMGTGPYQVGYFDVTLNVTDEGRTQMYECRYYYPATSGGEWADPDPAGAPYPTVIYHVYLPPLPTLPDPKYYNRTSDRERLEYIVSHGLVVLTYTPYKPVLLANERSLYVDLEWHTDNYNENVSSPLHGMVNNGAYGAMGECRGGSLSFLHASIEDRITAVCSLSPWFGGNLSAGYPGLPGWHKKERAWMVQKGGANTLNEDYIYSAYEDVDPDKIMVSIPKGGQRGPFRHDLVVAFFKYHLGGQPESETYLYGNESKNEVYTGKYRMKYEREDGDRFVFQPRFTIDVPSRAMTDESVPLSVTCDSYVLWEHPTLVHEWHLDLDGEPDIVRTGDPNVTHSFTDPGTFRDVRYKYRIGNFTITSNTATIRILNVWPTADAGENATVYQDDPFRLDASGSWDTPSDMDTLEYNWSFMGTVSGWLRDPTFELDTSQLRTFTANLQVRDRHGNWKTDSVTISVVNKPPQAIVGANMTSEEDEVVVMTGTGVDTPSDTDPLEFMWDFGDGTVSPWSITTGTSHTYIFEGTYTVTFHVRDSKGASSSTTMYITVSNVVPQAGVDHPVDGTKAVTEVRVRFAGWGRDTVSDNGTLRFTWDFGDGRTGDGADARHAYREAGEYTVTLTVEDDDGATAVVTRNVTIEERIGTALQDPETVSMAVGLVVVLGLAVVVATEPGKYWLGLLFAPLFTRRKEVLDNKTRHTLLGFIVTNPGVHYSALKDEFGLANGQAAYHLYVLERESVIRSVRDGKRKRFFSAYVKVPEDVGMSPEGTREAIVDLVRGRPGISQVEVMEELELDRDGASYYLRELVKEGRLRARKRGWYTVYSIRGRG